MATEAVAAHRVPPLENGDTLSREEFERRWESHPEIKKAELIGGQVYLAMTDAVPHSEQQVDVTAWLGLYRSQYRAVQALDNVAVRLPEDDLRADAVLRRREGGTSTASTANRVEGPPELVFEISESSAAYDLHTKKAACERGGILEYVVWQLYEDRLDWFRLEDGRYKTVEPGANGIIESTTFPGLRLDVPALLAGDLARVLAALGQLR
ncbi:MAG: Uma2 family endonuclease [Dehalococcoidia bacterium]